MSRLDLADYRERVAELYLNGPQEGEEGVLDWRRRREKLFLSHPQSPIPPDGPAPTYFPSAAEAVVATELEPAEGAIEVDTGGEDGVVRYERVGRARTPFGELTVLWTRGYGGGLFVPVRDGTAGQESYGGGRYLTDTIKGTFGRGLVIRGERAVTLDFNYLYNPSCAYDARWLCPLAPPENRLEAPVRAGEMAFPAAT